MTELEFLKKNHAEREHISITPADKWFRFEQDEELLGVVGISAMKSSIRVKCFYVRPDKRKEGIGHWLMETALKEAENRIITAYATAASKPIFEQYGFKAQSINKNNITYMKKEKKL